MVMTIRALQFLSPHLNCVLGSTVTGSVDTSYDANDLCDGDPSFPVFVMSGGLSLSVAAAGSILANGAVLANHSLPEGGTVTLGGDVSAVLTGPRVPPSGIRRNAFVALTPATPSTITVTTATPIEIGELLIGKFQELLALPQGSDLSLISFDVPAAGEYGGLSQSKGAVARRYGGTLILNDAQALLLDDWYEACKNNSLPSVIIPFPLRDPWVVKWVTYEPSPMEVDLGSDAAWSVGVEWEELPRFTPRTS